MRELGTRFGIGTRTIAAAIVEAGIKLSRSSVQRILREDKTPRPVRAALGMGSRRATPLHILHPKTVNRTWHLDLTVFVVHGMRIHIAALTDGFSRRLLSLKAYARTPTAIMMPALVKRAAKTVGAEPRFIVTDHGTQFLKRFEGLVGSLEDTGVVRCRVHDFRLNGKVERFFRTMKEWARLTLFAWFSDKRAVARSIQRRLDTYACWYNECRVHQGVEGRTPDRVWRRKRRRKPRPVLTGDPQPDIDVSCECFRGDPHLPVFKIRAKWPKAA